MQTLFISYWRILVPRSLIGLSISPWSRSRSLIVPWSFWALDQFLLSESMFCSWISFWVSWPFTWLFLTIFTRAPEVHSNFAWVWRWQGPKNVVIIHPGRNHVCYRPVLHVRTLTIECSIVSIIVGGSNAVFSKHQCEFPSWTRHYYNTNCESRVLHVIWYTRE